MPEIEVTAGGPAYEIEEGVYPAHLTETVADQLAKATFASGRDILRIWIRLDDMVDPEGGTIDIDAIASRRLSPSTKLWGWIENLGFRLDPETASRFNTDVIHGFAIRVVIGSKKKTDGSVWPTVENILAPSKGSPGEAENEQRKAAYYRKAAPQRSEAGESPFESGRDFTFFWKQVTRMGVTQEQAKSRMSRPIEQYDDDQLADLLELLRMDFVDQPANA